MIIICTGYTVTQRANSVPVKHLAGEGDIDPVYQFACPLDRVHSVL